jgi:hypothetical protein
MKLGKRTTRIANTTSQPSANAFQRTGNFTGSVMQRSGFECEPAPESAIKTNGAICASRF